MKHVIRILIIAIFNSNFLFSQDLDNSFGTNGKVLVDINNQYQFTSTLKVQTDGKIIVYGGKRGPGEFTIIRLNINGSLDNTFDVDGIKTIGLVTTSIESSNTMSLQADGKILIGGSDYDGTNVGSVLVRLNTDGSMDNTFGTNGLLRFDISTYEEFVGSILVLSNGKIVLVGNGYNGTSNEIYVAKLNSDGSFDSSFDTDGKVVISGVTGNNQAILQSDNKIVIGSSYKVIRINTDGSFDNSFGTNGVVALSDIEVTSLVLLESGKIALAGTKLGTSFAVARLNTNGSLDNSFGINGITFVDPAGIEYAANVFRTVAEDTVTNKLIAGGYSQVSSPIAHYMVVVEFQSDGTLGNYTTVNVGTEKSDVYSLLVQADRKIVAAGNSGNGLNDDIAVIRLNADFSTFLTTATTSETLTKGINLFPNPASQNINIHSSYNIEQVRVLDVLGKEMLSIKATGNTQVDISLLPKGLYNFVITTDHGIGTKKVSIQ
jgi:uncharacterized delta-60 repeat protein